MPTRIRLQRHGRKGKPFYHIVVADSRLPRDGRFIEKLGTYNPLSSPHVVDLHIENSISCYKKELRLLIRFDLYFLIWVFFIRNIF